MNDPEIHSPAQDSDLQWQVIALQRQVFLQLLALIVVTATIVFYLYYQSRVASKDLEAIRPRAIQIKQGYERSAPAIANLTAQLRSYGAKDPGFQPILKKYGLEPSSMAPRQ
jgi:hypothetical protein